jgi:hypothetical protein
MSKIKISNLINYLTVCCQNGKVMSILPNKIKLSRMFDHKTIGSLPILL